MDADQAGSPPGGTSCWKRLAEDLKEALACRQVAIYASPTSAPLTLRARSDHDPFDRRDPKWTIVLGAHASPHGVVVLMAEDPAKPVRVVEAAATAAAWLEQSASS